MASTQNTFSISINKIAVFSILFYSFFLIASCEIGPPRTSAAKPAPGTAPFRYPPQPVVAAPQPAAPTDLWHRIRDGLTWQTSGNTLVDQERRVLLRQDDYLALIAERADLYLYYIVEEVSVRGMPMEIALIPMVESTLNPFAKSHDGAAGLWQIMPGTGARLGLARDAGYDGRQALRDSTEGALDYLQRHHDTFDGDWLLAIAAYQAGEGTVSSAINANAAKGLPTDFWSLKLRQQSREYVAKIIALAQVVATPERYGVAIPYVANAPAFEIAETDSPLRFAEAADLAGVDVDTLRALNPGRLGTTVSSHRKSQLLLPAGTLDQFEEGLENIEPERPTGAANDVAAQGYRVRPGDSLYRIASRFNVSVSNIITWNALDPDDYLQPGQRLTLYPGDS